MKILRYIWNDIRQGENLDLYTTVVAAFLIAILALFNFNVQPLFAPVTLAVLGVLAVAALVNRHRLDEVLAKIAQSQGPKFANTFPDTFVSSLQQAKDLWVVGFSLRRTMNNHYSLFEQVLKRGGSVKFLLVYPDGQASTMAATKLFPRVGVERYRDQIRTTLEQLCELKRTTAGLMEVRTTDILPGFTIFAADPDTTAGILYLAYLPYESSSEHRPKLVLRASDGYTYHAFKRDMLTNWENATVWQFEHHGKSN